MPLAWEWEFEFSNNALIAKRRRVRALNYYIRERSFISVPERRSGISVIATKPIRVGSSRTRVSSMKGDVPMPLASSGVRASSSQIDELLLRLRLRTQALVSIPSRLIVIVWLARRSSIPVIFMKSGFSLYATSRNRESVPKARHFGLDLLSKRPASNEQIGHFWQLYETLLLWNGHVAHERKLLWQLFHLYEMHLFPNGHGAHERKVAFIKSHLKEVACRLLIQTGLL